MQKENPTLKQLLYPALIPFIMVAIAWLVFGFEVVTNEKVSYLGVFPQRVLSLPTVFTYWAIHGDIKHLFNNTAPLLFLGWGLFYYYPKIAFKILLTLTILPALWVWIGARPGFHIGASMIIYGLASFLFFSGVYAKNIRKAAFSLIIVFLYGGMVWGVLPTEPHISWEGHLFGAIAGLIMLWYYRKQIKPVIIFNSSISNTGSYNETEIEYTLIEKKQSTTLDNLNF